MKDEESIKLYLLPNLLTAGNLFCGFMAILHIFKGAVLHHTEGQNWMHSYENSLFFILGAFILDTLDGRIARFKHCSSHFGREFDSLADLVSFGVAPALLVFKIVLLELPNKVGWLVAFFYLACGALRLARFNAHSPLNPQSASREFTGFPIPAAAGLIASITLFLLHFYGEEYVIGNWKYGLAALMVFLSFMMFSNVQYPRIKEFRWKGEHGFSKLLFLILLVALTILYYRYAFAILFTGYLLHGLVREAIMKRWRRQTRAE